MNHTHKTIVPSNEEARKDLKWFLLDASGKTLGRFASEVAKILRGKHKPNFTPNIDTGDGVIIINADKIKVTGKKEARKIYHNYTGFIGGMKETNFRTMKAKKPSYMLEHAIKGMLETKTKLARKQLTKLRIFCTDQHNMQAQKPIPLNI